MFEHVKLQGDSLLTRATYGLVKQWFHSGKTSSHWICKLRDKRFGLLAEKRRFFKNKDVLRIPQQDNDVYES